MVCGGVGKGVVGLSVVTASSVSSERYERSIPTIKGEENEQRFDK